MNLRFEIKPVEKSRNEEKKRNLLTLTLTLTTYLYLRPTFEEEKFKLK